MDAVEPSGELACRQTQSTLVHSTKKRMSSAWSKYPLKALDAVGTRDFIVICSDTAFQVVKAREKVLSGREKAERRTLNVETLNVERRTLKTCAGSTLEYDQILTKQMAQ